jgi:hypothetical protein
MVYMIAKKPGHQTLTENSAQPRLWGMIGNRLKIWKKGRFRMETRLRSSGTKCRAQKLFSKKEEKVEAKVEKRMMFFPVFFST